jgi:hypothetical protein
MSDDDHKYMIVIRGLSGCGKTTIADLICDTYTDEDKDNDRRIAISANDYFYNDDDEFEFDPSKLKDAHHWCLQEVEVCALQGYELIVAHNTFTRQWEVEPYFHIANKNGYRISVLSMYDGGLNDMQLADRSVHDVPTYSIRNQRKRWELDMFREQKYGAFKKKVDKRELRKKNFKS